jgi:hypothetical protein
MIMTKQEALDLLGVKVGELATLLNISSQAISMWPDHKIPLGREYQVRDLAAGKNPLRASEKTQRTA